VRARRVAALLLLIAAAGCAGTPGPGDPLPTLPPVVQPLATRIPTSTPPPAPPAANEAPAAGAANPAPGAANPAPPAPSASPPDWTFSVVGDTWKDTPMLRYILQDAAAQGDVLQVNLGDLTPQGRPEQLADFARVIGAAALPVFPVPGNHDVAWSKTTAPFEQYWPRHQAFDRRNAHFTLVDDSAVTLDQAELDWIDADLSATQQPVKFVFMHVPALMPYPVPAESALQAGGPEFMALMEKHHVTAVYAGHLHAYTRVERNGIPYIITGGGGEPLHVPALLGGRYHYVRVAVRGTTASDTVVLLNNVPTPGP
jgi:hypothetical protein